MMSHTISSNDNGNSRLCRIAGRRIRQQREKLGWTLEQLALAAHRGEGQLARIEEGNANVTLEFYDYLSEVMGFEFDMVVK